MGKNPDKFNSGKESTGEHSGERNKFLYQPAETYDRTAETISRLAEKSGKSTSKWLAKIENRVLHLNKVSQEEQVSLVKRVVEPYVVRNTFTKFSGISNRAAKRAGLLDLGKNIEYKLALELHELWLQYIEDVIGKETSPQNIARMLALSDLQGAKLKIVESNCSTYVGIAGIVIRETHHAFNIVKEDNKVSLILKAGSVFAVEWKNYTFSVYGIHLVATPAQRSKRKLKAKSHL